MTITLDVGIVSVVLAALVLAITGLPELITQVSKVCPTGGVLAAMLTSAPLV